MYQRKRRGGDWVEQIGERGLVIREKELGFCGEDLTGCKPRLEIAARRAWALGESGLVVAQWKRKRQGV